MSLRTKVRQRPSCEGFGSGGQVNESKLIFCAKHVSLQVLATDPASPNPIKMIMLIVRAVRRARERMWGRRKKAMEYAKGKMEGTPAQAPPPAAN